MKARLWAVALCGVFFVFALAPISQAQDLGCGFYGYGYNYGALYRHMSANVPHFAAFPPVYYSYPVPRTYGYGPFAYPPYVKTPDVIVKPVKPVTIINPHVKQTKKADGDVTAAVDPRVPTPLVVLNPYVDQPERLARADR